MKSRLCILLALCCCIGLSAAPTSSKKGKNKKQEPKHYIDLHAGGGVSHLGYTLEGGKVDIGVSFSAGVGYTWFFKPWIGLQTGIGLTRIASTASLIDGQEWTGLVDYQGETYTHRIAFDGWKEQQQAYLFEVPLGLRFRYRKGESVAGLHAALGVKLAIPVISNYAHTAGSVTHSAWYDKWHLELHDLPGRFETEPFTVKQEESLQSKLNILNAEVFGEIGTTLRLNERSELFIAAYALYIPNNLCSVRLDARTPLGFANSHNNYTFMPEYRGLIGTDKVGAVHPWAAGLKLGFSIWPGQTEKQKKRQLRKLAKQFPELMPVKHDTLVLRDTIYMRDTLRLRDTVYRIVQQPKLQPQSAPQEPQMKRPTKAERQLADLLSQAVIWFHFDKYDPILEPAYILDSVAAMMHRHPDLRIHVNGHACVIGGDSYNQRLALRRAQAVAALLERKGIPQNRMQVVSYGASHPYRYNLNHQLAKDRRVEVVPEGYELKPEDMHLIDINTDLSSQAEPTVSAYTAFLGEEQIRAGSRLAQIARRWYRQPEYWIYLYEANADKIDDPQQVPVGLLIMIPDLKKTVHQGLTEQQALEDARRRIKALRE